MHGRGLPVFYVFVLIQEIEIDPKYRQVEKGKQHQKTY